MNKEASHDAEKAAVQLQVSLFIEHLGSFGLTRPFSIPNLPNVGTLTSFTHERNGEASGLILFNYLAFLVQVIDIAIAT